jgi:His-Xaa-Ser system radical SAM maturase HxsB
MDPHTARKAVEMAFSSPARYIKIEFQGGEPTLNIDVIKRIVEYAEELNVIHGKKVDYVLCTNLFYLPKDISDFIEKKNIFISTSLDGPQDIHDACRKTRQNKGSYDAVIDNIIQLRDRLGGDKISALVTVTPYNMNRMRDVVDEYMKHNFNSIFIRNVNPFGRFHANSGLLKYSVDNFVRSYTEVLKYIIDINIRGTFFSEYYAILLLSRILTPYATGFVDLQSPSGAGISGVIYDYNGDVYVSDEGRMLAATNGDNTFCLGNVCCNTWQDIFCGFDLFGLTAKSCLEAVPGCSWCVYLPYCGSDPVRNYFEYGNVIGKRPESSFCQIHKKLFDMLFNYLEDSPDDIHDVFWSWLTNRNIMEVRDSGAMSLE